MLFFLNTGFTHSVVIVLISLQHLVKQITKIIALGLSFIKKNMEGIDQPHSRGSILIGTIILQNSLQSQEL